MTYTGICIMPKKPPINCTFRGCPNLVEPGQGGLCEQHRRKRHKWDAQSRTDRADIKIYSTKAWRHIRKLALQRDQGWCVICKEKPADVVDHIKEIKDGGTPYDLNNLQSLCNSCHAIKTNEVARQRKF